MTITKEYLKELRELYFDVAQDSDKTELRTFLAHFETEDCIKIYSSIGEQASYIDELVSEVSSAFEIQGFIKGFIYAKELLK